MNQEASVQVEQLQHLVDMAHRMGYSKYLGHLKSDTIYSDGLKINLDILENGPDAPTVVVVPGTALYALCMIDLMVRLYESGYNVVGIDPRGHGRSEGDRGDYTINEVVRDVQGAISYSIDKYNPSVSVLGASQGGIVSLYIAAKDERVKSVICQNFADLNDVSAVNSLARIPALSKVAQPFLKRFGKYLPNVKVPIETYVNLRKMKVKHYGNVYNFVNQDPLALTKVSMRALQSLVGTKLSKPVEEIKVPVFVFQGSADHIFPVEYTQSLFGKLNCKKRLEIFPDLSHAMLVDNIDDVYPSILEWLQEIH